MRLAVQSLHVTLQTWECLLGAAMHMFVVSVACMQ